jgi:hypothetical protein
MPAWRRGGVWAYYATARSPDGTRYHLTVEKMEGMDTRWEWITWCSGTLASWSCHGYSECAREAKKAAERANSNRIPERY